MQKKLFLSFIILFIYGCSPVIRSSFTVNEKKLIKQEKVIFLDVQHELPADAKKIGESRFRDSMLSIDCNFNSNLIKAREIARSHGANIVKIIKTKEPDLLSSCHRMDIEYYLSKENLDNLIQYNLQIE